MFRVAGALLLGIAVVACGGAAPSAPTPDIAATVVAAVERAIPSPTSTPTPDIRATVEAEVRATLAANPTSTLAPQPSDTPIPTPTQEATPTETPPPTSTPTSIPSPSPTAIPRPTASPTPNLATMVQDATQGVVRVNTLLGNGSGVIFQTTGNGTGYILTNYHVVEGATGVEVQTSNGATYRATLKGYDAVKDLAVLEICCGRFRSLPFTDATTVKSGTEVIAVGYPLGLAGPATVTSGIVSAVRYDPGFKSWVIQTDAPINPGNSGGPLLSVSGEVLGINTYILNSSASGDPIQGVGFALSEQTIRGVLEEMRLGKRVGFPAPTATRTPWPTPTPQVTWVNYQSKVFEFSINVPSNWKIDDSDPYFVTFDEPDNFAGAWVAVGYQVYSSPTSLAKYYLEWMQQEHPGQVHVLYEPDGNRPVWPEVGHVHYRIQASADNCVEEIKVWVWVKDLKAHYLSVSYCRHSIAEFDTILTQMANSFIRR